MGSSRRNRCLTRRLASRACNLPRKRDRETRPAPQHNTSPPPGTPAPRVLTGGRGGRRQPERARGASPPRRPRRRPRHRGTARSRRPPPRTMLPPSGRRGGRRGGGMGRAGCRGSRSVRLFRRVRRAPRRRAKAPVTGGGEESLPPG